MTKGTEAPIEKDTARVFGHCPFFVGEEGGSQRLPGWFGALVYSDGGLSYLRPQPVFEILSISANIFSFSFCELDADG